MSSLNNNNNDQLAERSFFNKSKAHRLSNLGDVHEDLTEIAADVVSFLPQLSDVVAFYSCASPLRDATAGPMMEHLANQHWNNNRPKKLLVKNSSTSQNNTSNTNNNNNVRVNFDDYSVHRERTKEDEEIDEKVQAITSTDMVKHILFFGTASATSCNKIRIVDISLHHQRGGNENDCITDDEFINICKWSHNLEVLIADGNDGGKLTEGGVHYAATCLARNENFRKLSLKNVPLSDLKGLAHVKTLEHLDCSLNQKLVPDGIRALTQLPKLKEVYFVRCPLLGSVDTLASSPSIEKLDISACPISSIEGLARGLKTLKWLKADATKIENGLAPLQESTSLEWISIRNVRATEEELACLARVPFLKHACIYNANIESVNFLEDFTNIESLDIGMLQVRRADFREDTIVPHLTRLSMRFCPVVETIYMQRQWGNSLVFLDLLNASQLSDDGLDMLGEGLPHLTTLILAGTGISDLTVENEISKLSKLQYLDLSNTAVTSVNCLTMSPKGFIDEQEDSNNNNNNTNNCFVDQHGVKSPGCPYLKVVKLECCRNFPGYRRGGGLKGLGDLLHLEELHIGCTNARDFSRTPVFEKWPALKVLDCSGLLRPPREFVTFCLACSTLRKLVLTSCNMDNGWREVVETVGSQRYIEMEF